MDTQRTGTRKTPPDEAHTAGFCEFAPMWALRTAIAAGLSRAAGCTVLPSELRMPSRNAALSSPVAIQHGLDADALASQLTAHPDLSPVYGAPPVSRVRAKNRWLLFDLSDAYYTALIHAIRSALPPAGDDRGSYACNRMLVLSRHGGSDCPKHARVQSALLLTALLTEDDSPSARKRAETALLTMMHDLPPRERAALQSVSGSVGDAAARILYRCTQKK